MRLIGLAERALDWICRRVQVRTSFGRPVAEQTVTLEGIAEARMMIRQTRLLTLKAAASMDRLGNKAALAESAMIKVVAPNVVCKVIDLAIQAFGSARLTDGYGPAYAYALARLFRLVDGPDEVHRDHIGRLELRKYPGPTSSTDGSASVLPADHDSEQFRTRPVLIA